MTTKNHPTHVEVKSGLQDERTFREEDGSAGRNGGSRDPKQLWLQDESEIPGALFGAEQMFDTSSPESKQQGYFLNNIT